ncbi:MAG: hypothetical protein MHPSP_000866 [Paramarteilia canceri]
MTLNLFEIKPYILNHKFSNLILKTRRFLTFGFIASSLTQDMNITIDCSSDNGVSTQNNMAIKKNSLENNELNPPSRKNERSLLAQLLLSEQKRDLVSHEGGILKKILAESADIPKNEYSKDIKSPNGYEDKLTYPIHKENLGIDYYNLFHFSNYSQKSNKIRQIVLKTIGLRYKAC